MTDSASLQLTQSLGVSLSSCVMLALRNVLVINQSLAKLCAEMIATFDQNYKSCCPFADGRTKDQAKIINIDTYVRSKIGMMKSTSLPEACAFHEKQTYELNKLSRRELDLSFPNRQVSASATSRSFSVRNILRSTKKSAQNSV